VFSQIIIMAVTKGSKMSCKPTIEGSTSSIAALPDVANSSTQGGGVSGDAIAEYPNVRATPQ
jgi:hypothetical protein